MGERELPFRFRECAADFEVTEIPEDAEPPDPDGTHLWFTVRKEGVSTEVAAARLARALGVSAGAVSFAGRKDAVARTTQRMSVEHVSAEALMSVSLEGLTIEEPTPMRRRIRLGQLAGNRFRLRLTGLSVERAGRLHEVLGGLAAAGFPNLYGPQRFGRDGEGWRTGAMLVRLEAVDYLRALAGPEPGDAATELLRRAASGTQGERRRAGEFARDLNPDLAPVARELARRRPRDPVQLLRAVPKRTRAFHLSALQSWLFNGVVLERQRQGLPCTATDGDVLVADPWERDRGAPRVLPGGPMWAADLEEASGRPGEVERSVLEREGFQPRDFAPRETGLSPRGARRALLVTPRNVSVERQRPTGAGPVSVWVTFDLPPGSYATSLLAALGTTLGR